MRRGVALALALLPALATPLRAADFTAWTNRLKITLGGYSRPEPLTNFPVLIQLGTNVPGFDFATFALPRGADLRFTDATRTQEYPYEIEAWNVDGRAPVWVRLPVLTAESVKLYAVWGVTNPPPAPAYTTNGTVWNSAYEAVWHLGEVVTSAAGSAVDSSAHGHGGRGGSGSVAAPPTRVSGRIGYGQSFNGDSSQIAVPTVPFLSNFTVSVWANAAALDNKYFAMVSRGEVYSFDCNFDLALRYRSGSGDYYLACYMNNAETRLGVEKLFTFNPVGTWHHYAAAFDASALTLAVYLDGALVTNAPVAKPPRDGGQTFMIGRPFSTANGNDVFFNGRLDELRLCRTAQSSNWLWAAWLNVASNDVFTTMGSVNAPDETGTVFEF